MLLRLFRLIVGNQSKLIGLISSTDVLNYLNKITSPFILIGEIERAIRIILSVSIPKAELLELVKITLAKSYEPEDIPTSLKEMSFNDYKQIICYGDAWHFFEKVFGPNRHHRNRTRTKLEEIRDIRNIVFHFKMEITQDELQKLQDYRIWIKNAYTACINIWRSDNNVQ